MITAGILILASNLGMITCQLLHHGAGIYTFHMWTQINTYELNLNVEYKSIEVVMLSYNIFCYTIQNVS